MMIDRRRLLAGLAAAAAAPACASRSAQAQMSASAQDWPREVDVAVIGAGAAGIAAGHALRHQGLRFVVLEARDRLGGRVFTDSSLGPIFDAGAQFVHWGERNPWRRVAQELGIAITEDNGWGSAPAIFVAGRRLTPEERWQRSGGFGRVRRFVEEAVRSGRDMSFADAVKPAPEALPNAAGLTRFTLGEEPEHASIADYEQLWAGDDYILPEGYGRLVARHGVGLPVALATPATRLRWDGKGVAIETPRGTLSAKAAVVTVPVGVLKAGGLRFTPDLPGNIQDALDGLRMGALTKIAVRYDPARLGPLETEDYFDISPEGGQISFEFRHRRQEGLALALLGGDHARAICEMGEAGAVAHAIDRLVAMLGSQTRPAFTGGRLAGWWADPYARGSYSIAKPGRLSARVALRAPIGGRIFLAGEATGEGGAMTAGGAYLEGERAAALAAAVART